METDCRAFIAMDRGADFMLLPYFDRQLNEIFANNARTGGDLDIKGR